MISTNQFTAFDRQLNTPLTKTKITTLQINLGKKCNLVCNHCHVEASPQRTEELSEEVCQDLITMIHQFPQIETVDLTGGAPEMNYGFRPLVEAARARGKQVIARSNLTIYFQPGYEDLPAYCARQQVRIVASLPCYLEKNVDRMRGHGVFERSIRALQILNQLGYGEQPELILDLVYNPPMAVDDQFSLPPAQGGLEQDYKTYLNSQYGIQFNHLFTIANLPIGRTKLHLQQRQLADTYLRFLANNFNQQTIDHLMCRNQLSIDYLGQVYDCDFNQMENIPARQANGELLTVRSLLASGNLDLISTVQTADFCYGCTAGCGSSCGGSLVNE
jgi:radical SAM/Cys-rich protein